MTLAIVALTTTAITKTYKTEHVSITVDEPEIPSLTVSITDFGGVGDGLTLNTKAFDEAMRTLEAKGGGTLVVPGGTWLTGPIVFRSHIRLMLKSMAVIKFCPDVKLYKSLEETFGLKGEKRYQSPFGACRQTDIEICGDGIIDGAGESWRPFKRPNGTKYEWARILKKEGVVNAKEDRWYPMTAEEQAIYKAAAKDGDSEKWKETKDHLRPFLLHFIECSRIRLEGVTFQNSPMWNLHPELCDNITIERCNVRNKHNAANGDGLDLESCRNVYLSRTVFDVGDDGITIKSGKDEEGRRRGVPTRDVVIDSCVVYNAHGGFVVGSEMSGGVRNISVKDCIFMGTDNGLRFKSNRERGGTVDSIFVDNIYMENIVANGILFDLYYFQPSEGKAFLKDMDNYRVKDVPAKGITTPTFRNIHINNVICAGAERAIWMDGLPENRIDGIHISNLKARALEPSLISEATNITLKRLSLDDNTGGTLYLHNVKRVKINAEKGKPSIKTYGSETEDVSF